MSIHTAVTFTSKLFVSLLVGKQGMRKISSNCIKYNKSRQIFSAESRIIRGGDRENDPRGSGRCSQSGITAAAVEVITKFAHRGSGRLEIGLGGCTNMLVAA